MPNGRIEAVYVARDDLMRLFDGVQGDPVVGRILGVEAVLSETRSLAAAAEEKILLEGQNLIPDHTVPEGEAGGLGFILHLSRESWLLVRQDDPVFEILKDFWLKELGRQ